MIGKAEDAETSGKAEVTGKAEDAETSGKPEVTGKAEDAETSEKSESAEKAGWQRNPGRLSRQRRLAGQNGQESQRKQSKQKSLSICQNRIVRKSHRRVTKQRRRTQGMRSRI